MVNFFKHELCAEPAQAFAGHSQILSGQGDTEMGRRIVKLAKQMLEKVHQIDRVRAKNRESIILGINAFFVESYCIPIPQVLVSLQLAYVWYGGWRSRECTYTLWRDIFFCSGETNMFSRGPFFFFLLLGYRRAWAASKTQTNRLRLGFLCY